MHMGNVIYFQKAKKKKEEKFNQSTKKTQTATEKATKEYPIEFLFYPLPFFQEIF